MSKTQLLDFRSQELNPDNLEGFSFGTAKDGTPVLIVAADNNFSKHQTNQFFAFKVVRRPH